MFMSKLLNKLFFNKNNDCYFTTLLNLNQFMLTMDNHKAILDHSTTNDDFSSSVDSMEDLGFATPLCSRPIFDRSKLEPKVTDGSTNRPNGLSYIVFVYQE